MNYTLITIRRNSAGPVLYMPLRYNGDHTYTLQIDPWNEYRLPARNCYVALAVASSHVTTLGYVVTDVTED